MDDPEASRKLSWERADTRTVNGVAVFDTTAPTTTSAAPVDGAPTASASPSSVASPAEAVIVAAFVGESEVGKIELSNLLLQCGKVQYLPQFREGPRPKVFEVIGLFCAAISNQAMVVGSYGGSVRQNLLQSPW
jgi:hypothetical protein